MNRITSVKGINVKGLTFEHQLAPLTCIIGKSFTGKTAILDAVTIATYGYHPKLGKRPMDTFQLAGPGRPEMSSSINLSNGEINWHVWKQSKGGAITHEGSEPVTQSLPWIEYLDLKRHDRVKYVFDQLNLEAEGVNDSQLLGVIKSLIVPDPGADTAAALAECERIVEKFCKARVEEDATLQDVTEAIINEFENGRKESALTVRRMEGLAQGSAYLLDGSAPAANVDQELAAARQKYDKLRTELAGLMARADAGRRAAERVRDLERRKAGLVASQPAAATEMAAMERELAGIKAEDLTALAASIRATEKIVTVTASEAAQAAKEIKLRQDNLAETKAHKSCPVCLSKRKGWWKEFAEKAEASIANLGKERQRLEVENGSAQSRLRAFRDRETAAVAAVQRQQELGNKLRDAKAANERRQWWDQQMSQIGSDLEAARVESAKFAAPEGVAALEAEISGAAGVIERLTQAQKKFIAAKAQEASVLESKRTHRQQSDRARVMKLAAESLVQWQQRAIDGAIGKLFAVANQFTNGILRGEVAYRDGDMGILRDGHFVNHKTLSGTEQALTYAGITVALAQRSPLKIAVIDELGIGDAGARAKIVERLGLLVGNGTLGNAIVADTALPGGIEESAHCAVIRVE
jgi:hypothetical protein